MPVLLLITNGITTTEVAYSSHVEECTKSEIIENELNANNVVGPIITIEIGRKKKDCQRFGICSATYDDTDSPIVNPNSASGTMTATSSGHLQFDLKKIFMDANTANNYFGGGYFIVEEDFDVPLNILQSVGKTSYTIRVGLYPIVEDNDSFVVVF